MLVVDFASMSLSYLTAVASASTLTVWQSNDDGLTSTDTLTENSWSVVTSIRGPGIYTIDPGARWLRTTCPSLDSTSTIVLQGWTG
jgi:hypothetical protein